MSKGSKAAETDVEVKTDEAPIEVSEAEAPQAEAAPERGPMATLADIEREVERSFSRLFNRVSPLAWEFPSLPSLKEAFEAKLPKVDVIDRDDEIVIEAELPGMRKSDIDVSLADDSITIKTNVETQKKEDGDFHRREIHRESSTRTLTLPAAVDASEASATFKDGLLRVAIPKAAGKQRRKVNVD